MNLRVPLDKRVREMLDVFDGVGPTDMRTIIQEVFPHGKHFISLPQAEFEKRIKEIKELKKLKPTHNGVCHVSQD